MGYISQTYIDGFVQRRCNSSALSMELRLFALTRRYVNCFWIRVWFTVWWLYMLAQNFTSKTLDIALFGMETPAIFSTENSSIKLSKWEKILYWELFRKIEMTINHFLFGKWIDVNMVPSSSLSYDDWQLFVMPWQSWDWFAPIGSFLSNNFQLKMLPWIKVTDEYAGPVCW